MGKVKSLPFSRRWPGAVYGLEHQFPAVLGLTGAELGLRRLTAGTDGDQVPARRNGAPGWEPGPLSVRPEVLVLRLVTCSPSIGRGRPVGGDCRHGPFPGGRQAGHWRIGGRGHGKLGGELLQ